MKIEQILIGNAAPMVTIGITETVGIAARLLVREKIGALVVKDVCRIEGDVVVGMFSERDLVHAIALYGASSIKMRISELVSMNVISCAPGDTIAEARTLMETNHIRQLLIIDRQNVIGVISIRDLLSAERENAATIDPPSRPNIAYSASTGH